MNKNLRQDRERINVTFDIESYKQIKLIAEKQNKSMSEVVRDWSMQGLNGTLTQNNLDVLAPIIREQLKSILTPAMDRLAAMTGKTCVQAGTAAYLAAETISKLLPIELAEDYQKVYYSARKRAVNYMKGNSDIDMNEL